MVKMCRASIFVGYIIVDVWKTSPKSNGPRGVSVWRLKADVPLGERFIRVRLSLTFLKRVNKLRNNNESQSHAVSCLSVCQSMG